MADPKIPVTATNYRDVVTMLYAWAQVLAAVDLPKLLHDIEHAHAVGPIVDPTMYKASAAAMREDSTVIKAALELRKIGLRLAEAPGPEPLH